MSGSLAARSSALDTVIRRSLRRWRVPGAAVAVVQNDAIVYAQGFGVCQIGHPARVSARTRFFIGSCTKSFTAAALGMLVDEGKLGWDAPLHTCLP